MSASDISSNSFQQFDDVMKKIDFSSGCKIHAWRIFFSPDVNIQSFFYNEITAVLHKQILQQSLFIQMIFFNNARLFVYHLDPDNRIEIEETPLDLMKFAGGNEKIVNGYKKTGNLLFYAQSNDINGLFEIRTLLNELTNSDEKTDYEMFVPEAPVMRILVNHLPIKRIQSAYKGEYLDTKWISPESKPLEDNRIKYIELNAELTQPDCIIKILFYPSEEELRLLNLVYSIAPSHKKIIIQQYNAEHSVQFQILPKKIIVVRPGNKNPDKTSDPQQIKKVLDIVVELINPIDVDVSRIASWSFCSSSDLLYYWEDILNHITIY